MSQLLLLVSALAAGPTATSTPVQVGVRHTLASEILGETRTILVAVPPDYGGGSSRYPVLYRLDGDMVMFLDSLAAERWLAEQSERIPSHIVIGVPNTDRGRDMGAAREPFFRFIVEELLPFVESRYRTTGQCRLGGQSASANFAAELLVSRPGVFDGYVLGSLGPSNAELDRLLETLGPSWRGGATSVFLTHGELDTNDPTGERGANAERFLSALLRVGAGQVRGVLRAYPDEGHVPGSGLYDGLKWIFAPQLQ